VADLVANAAFPADELTLMKRRLAASWRSNQSSSSAVSLALYSRAVYGSAIGALVDEDSFAALTTDGLRAWHREHYSPSSTVVSIAGAIRTDAVERRVRDTLAGWQKSGYIEQQPAMPPAPPRQVHVQDRPGSVQTSLVVGAAAVDRVHPDYLALVVANRVLGGTPAARLFVKLREERGLTTGVLSQLVALKFGGDWRAFGDVNAARTGEAVDLLLAEVQRITTEPVPAAELETAKRSIVASFAVTLEQLSQVGAYMTTRRTYGLSADYWDRYPEKIMSISSADVQRVAAMYFDPSRLQIVAVGDASQLVPLLSSHGTVIRHR